MKERNTYIIQAAATNITKFQLLVVVRICWFSIKKKKKKMFDDIKMGFFTNDDGEL